MSQCLECGLTFDGWPCPQCATRKQHEDRIADAHEEHESNIREALEADHESRREAANALLEAQAELFVQEERAREQHRAELEELARRDNQARQKIASETWRLQAEDKAKRARELYKAGMYQEAADLCLEAADPKRGGDPGNYWLYMTAYDSFHMLGQEDNAYVMLQKQVTLVKALDKPSQMLIEVLQRIIRQKNNAELLRELITYISHLTYFPKEVLKGLISASRENVKFLHELMAHVGQHLTYFPKEILNELISTQQREIARIVYLNSLLKAAKWDVLVYGIELDLKPEEVLERFGAKFTSVKNSQMADLLHAYLADVEFSKRHDVFTNHEGMIKEKWVFSGSTINIVRSAIQKRYKEWEPSINKQFAKEAADYAATASVSSDKPKRASWVVGAISFVSLMMFTPLNFIFSFILSGVGAYIVLIGARKQILNDVKKHNLAALRYKEKTAASAVGFDINAMKEMGDSNAMAYGILLATMVVVAGLLVGKFHPELLTAEKTTVSNAHDRGKTRAASTVAKPPVGTWAGTVNQPGYGSFLVTMKLSGVDGGSVDYPSIGCGGPLSFSGESNGSYFYIGRITYGKNKCIDGRVEVKPAGNAVHYVWSDDKSKATGTLNVTVLDSAPGQRPTKKPPEKSAHQKGHSAASYVRSVEKDSGSARFKHVNDKYPLYNEYKAIAISTVPNERWGDGLVVGYAYEYPSQEEANERAIYECNRESRGRYRVSGCALYATGDKVVQ